MLRSELSSPIEDAVDEATSVGGDEEEEAGDDKEVECEDAFMR